jgi:ABC-type multidrug transport system fused ATPase/permease subunit
MSREDREFDIELLKIQVTHKDIISQAMTMIAVEFSTFISIAMVLLGFGLNSSNLFYVFFAIFAVIILVIMVFMTGRYFNSKKVKQQIEKYLEEELKPIRKKFIESMQNNVTLNKNNQK